jgi:hypothetical protein
MKPCKGCKRPVDPLEIFPGGICLECYAASEEGRKPLSAEGVSDLWRKVF